MYYFIDVFSSFQAQQKGTSKLWMPTDLVY